MLLEKEVPACGGKAVGADKAVVLWMDGVMVVVGCVLW